MDKTLISNKTRINHDNYVFDLAPMYQQIAFEALHESETTRVQALNQMREWISKDPYIVKCRTDSSFLLRFLRTSKFNIQIACQRLQKYLATRQIYSDWHFKLDVDDPLIAKSIHDGLIIPLPDRTPEGRRILIHRLHTIDVNAISPIDCLRYVQSCYETLLDDEESQIAGYVSILDYNGLNLKHCAWMNLLQLKNFLASTVVSVPARVCHMIIVNFPDIVQVFFICLTI